MSSDTVQQIKDRLSIVDVVSTYLKLDRAGGALRARCPFHAEKSPSFFVSPDRGTYHCFGCNVGGDIFSFVEAIEGVDFKGALKMLADRAGVEIVYQGGGREKKDSRDRLFEVMEAATIYYVSRFSDEAKKYLKDRGLEDVTARTFRLGFAGNAWSELSEHLKTKGFSEAEILEAGLAKKNERGGLTDKFRNRIMFPINDSAGRVVAFSGRIFGADASPEAPKYLNSPETPLFHKSRVLYGFDKAKLSMRKLNCAVLVEGQMDLLMSHQAGWANTVAVSGTAFTAEHAGLIKRMTDNIVLALDADEAGIKAAGRAAREALAGGLNVKVAQISDGKDPADLIKAQGADAWRATIRDAKDIITFLLDVLQKHTPQQDKFRRSVELVVLPFLVDVQSPIAREQYTREISQRLGVSEKAVAEAVAKVPLAPRSPAEHAVPASPQPPNPQKTADRVQQAFSLLLWQESLAKPSIDVAVFGHDLQEAIGAEAFEMLRALPDKEKESLRFSAEHAHGNSGSLKTEGAMLVRRILQERLAAELARVGAARDAAESRGDEAEEARLTAESKVLTSRIAQLHISV
ncbi:DNA primase [Candidatus Kaiserbacteria bacterium]|nr:DNA primase [Candidatus Kaiserbacteria bacterium]